MLIMGYKRAEWHSGLTYKQTCRECGTTFEYNDWSLDFRPWFADGFVYCPRCQTPIRHSENFALNNNRGPVITGNEATGNSQPACNNTSTAKFCTNCGAPFRDGDLFCGQCGTKR